MFLIDCAKIHPNPPTPTPDTTPPTTSAPTAASSTDFVAAARACGWAAESVEGADALETALGRASREQVLRTFLESVTRMVRPAFRERFREVIAALDAKA